MSKKRRKKRAANKRRTLLKKWRVLGPDVSYEEIVQVTSALEAVVADSVSSGLLSNVNLELQRL